MEPRSAQPLLDELGRSGFASEASALAAARATLAALAPLLGEADRADLADLLPDALARALDEPAVTGGLDLADRIAARTGTSRAIAIEQAQLVARALWHGLPPELRGRLDRHLASSGFVELTAGPATTAAPAATAAPHHPHTGPTLASGRPGARHPLAEAATPPAHAHSIARQPRRGRS